MKLIFSILNNAIFAWIITGIIIYLGYKHISNIRDEYRSQMEVLRVEKEREIERINNEANRHVSEKRREYEAKIQHEHEVASEAIRREKEAASEKIRMLQEQIEEDKTNLMKKSEKEILADMSVSLGGFAKRIERIENQLTPIEQEMELIVDKVDNIGVTVADAEFHLKTNR